MSVSPLTSSLPSVTRQTSRSKATRSPSSVAARAAARKHRSAGVQGDAVPLPEREVSSLPSIFPRLPPQAAQERYPNSYKQAYYCNEELYGLFKGTSNAQGPPEVH